MNRTQLLQSSLLISVGCSKLGCDAIVRFQRLSGYGTNRTAFCANPQNSPTISRRISKSRQTPTKQGFWTYSPGRLAPKIWIWLRWNDGFGEKWQSYVAKSRSGQRTKYPKPLQEACLEHKAITIFYSSKDTAFPNPDRVRVPDPQSPYGEPILSVNVSRYFIVTNLGRQRVGRCQPSEQAGSSCRRDSSGGSSASQPRRRSRRVCR